MKLNYLNGLIKLNGFSLNFRRTVRGGILAGRTCLAFRVFRLLHTLSCLNLSRLPILQQGDA